MEKKKKKKKKKNLKKKQRKGRGTKKNVTNRAIWKLLSIHLSRALRLVTTLERQRCVSGGSN